MDEWMGGWEGGICVWIGWINEWLDGREGWSTWQWR